MLKLENIVKSYKVGDVTTHALKGVSIEFRQNEFVSILGHSGCGKTTLLNIVGGLDRYTSGDLFINGKSTKSFSQGDWDVYRNDSIGFVFQSYNLIPHQTVLSNVELALTLSGVSKSERRKKAEKMLEKVGLSEHIHKKPNQLSGGQMQRVAIARALINDPEILLADEPTGALDSETSVQIMELLKEIANEKLVIMVTHNPELAEEYSTRIVKLVDGKVVDDSNPYKTEPIENIQKTKKRKKISLKRTTALSLSLNNLLTKKGRTFMTSLAGSIGIIGIALILSISSGVQGYINKVQEDTLSAYPITIMDKDIDFGSVIKTLMGTDERQPHEDGKVYSNSVLSELMNTMTSEIKENDLTSFKQYLDNDASEINKYLLDVQYTYDADINLYRADTENGVVKVNPSVVYESVMKTMGYSASSGGFGASMDNQRASSLNVWTEMLDNEELVHSQYDLIYGAWPKSANEVVFVVDKNNEVSDMALYTLGIKDQSEMEEQQTKIFNGEEIEVKETSYSYDEILGLSFKVTYPADYYEYDELTKTYIDKSKDDEFMKKLIDSGEEIKIVGIIRPNEDAVASSINGAIGYTSELTRHYIEETEKRELVKRQLENTDVDVFTGIAFPTDEEPTVTMEDIQNYILTLPADQQAQMSAYLSQMSEEEAIEKFSQYAVIPTTDATLEDNLTKLGYAKVDTPATINLYAVDFESKDKIKESIDNYNSGVDDESKKIEYTDYMGIIMSSVTTIINIISYVLIAFVSISLVVSSIMIGIITYTSVLERTKEIGILRAIGASKKDVSRVFNAETFIVGLTSGAIGIIITLLLDILANFILTTFTSVPPIVYLPPMGAVVLIIISTVLTLIAGLIPSKIASNKDPVVALRTE